MKSRTRGWNVILIQAAGFVQGCESQVRQRTIGRDLGSWVLQALHKRQKPGLQSFFAGLGQIDETEGLKPALRGPHGEHHLCFFADGGLAEVEDQFHFAAFRREAFPGASGRRWWKADAALPRTWRRLGSRMRVRTEPRNLTRNGRSLPTGRLRPKWRPARPILESGTSWLEVWHFATSGRGYERTKSVASGQGSVVSGQRNLSFEAA